MLVWSVHLCTHSPEGGVLSHSTGRVQNIVRDKIKYGSRMICLYDVCKMRMSFKYHINRCRIVRGMFPKLRNLLPVHVPLGPQGPRSLAGLWFPLCRLSYRPPQENQKSNNMQTSWSKNDCSVRKMASKWWLLDQFVLFAGLVALAGIGCALIFVTLSLWLAFLKGKLLFLPFIHMVDFRPWA